MAVDFVMVKFYRCEDCSHNWLQRYNNRNGSEFGPMSLSEDPRRCPKCKSTIWNRVREKVVEAKHV